MANQWLQRRKNKNVNPIVRCDDLSQLLVYGLKTPERYMIMHTPKCERRWKRTEVLSSTSFLIYKDYESTSSDTAG